MDGDMQLHMPISPNNADEDEPGEDGPTLTEANLKKCDSLMMLDEEAKKLVSQELKQNLEQEEQMMQAARLK